MVPEHTLLIAQAWAQHQLKLFPSREKQLHPLCLSCLIKDCRNYQEDVNHLPRPEPAVRMPCMLLTCGSLKTSEINPSCCGFSDAEGSWGGAFIPRQVRSMPRGQAACPASPHLAVPAEARPSRYSTSCPALQVSPKASSSLEGKQKPQGSSGCSLLHHRTHSPMPSSLSRRPAWAMGSRDEEPTSLLLHQG